MQHVFDKRIGPVKDMPKGTGARCLHCLKHVDRDEIKKQEDSEQYVGTCEGHSGNRARLVSPEFRSSYVAIRQ